MTVQCNDEPAKRLPWTADVAAGVEQDANELLAVCGLLPRPPKRLWLLRPPPGYASLDDVLAQLSRVARRIGVHAMASPEMVALVADEIARVFPPAVTDNDGAAGGSARHPDPEDAVRTADRGHSDVPAGTSTLHHPAASSSD